MNSISIAGLLLLGTFGDIPTSFWQAAPIYQQDPTPQPNKTRAVLLIHGLVPRPLAPSKALKPEANSWQLPGSELVDKLSGDFDVFGLSYAQKTPVDWVCHCRGMQEAIKTLKSAGYKELVLVGHSAGGIIARRFVESYPNAGVTKVITVATPHAGSLWANLPQFGLPSYQIPFIRSLAPEYRALCNTEKYKIGNDTQFGCVVCGLPRLGSDTVVSVASQWPEDLQKQGVPISMLKLNHFDAVRTTAAVKLICELARDDLKRWTPEQVEAGLKLLK